MLKTRFWHVIAVLLLLPAASAANVVVLPFGGQDPVLGTAVAHAVAGALAEEHDVIGPAASPTLVPPFLVGEGFYNPAGYFSDTTGPGITMMLRAGSGADLALNGRIDTVDGLMVLELQTAHAGGVNTVVLQVPEGDAGGMARRVTAVASHVLGSERPAPVPDIAMDGVDGARARAIYEAGRTGGLQSALDALSDPLLADDPYSLQLRQAIEAVSEGRRDADSLLLATLSLNTAGVDEIRSALYFESMWEETGQPVFRLWQAMLLASSGFDSAATEALHGAASYPYGLAVLHSRSAAPADTVRAALPAADVPALIVYAVYARSTGETDLEQEALQRLTRLDPWQVWAFERLSFIAFDEDRPLDAGQALAVAVRLVPDSDLYWTNLGWAQYLLGLLEQSEQSSIRATLLAPQQYIAHYNIGLVMTVTGRIAEAASAYETALRYDPAVDDAAIDDLTAALRLYPDEPAVHYSLARLLEAAGQRAEAVRHYTSFLRRHDRGEFAERARARIVQLQAPPPVLQLPGGLSLLLGSAPVAADSLQAGDPVRPMFEVYTPGEALPTQLSLTYSLASEDGETALSEEHQLTLPADTVGFVIDRLTFELPRDLPAGDWLLGVTVQASEDREVSASLPLFVNAAADPLRRLIGYGITLQSFEGTSPLLDRRDLGNWDVSAARLLAELRLTEQAADEVLPVIGTGRFEGLTGGQAFAATTEADLRDFINWIAHPELEGASFVFVDTYAQWVVEGAPVD